MPSVAEMYNQEVTEGHREAVAALRDLLAHETSPAERRKLANALLRARPVKLAETDESKQGVRAHPAHAAAPEPQPKSRPVQLPAALAHLSSLLAMFNRDEEDKEDHGCDLDTMIDKEIDANVAESS